MDQGQKKTINPQATESEASTATMQDRDVTAKKSEEQQENTLQACQQELAEWKDKYLRLSADFQNYKRRQTQEQSSLRRMMQGKILFDLLRIVDDFDRALEEAKTEESSGLAAWLEGFSMIRKELYKLLDSYGVKEIETYDEFDPEIHEAVMQVDSEDHQSGSIVEVLEKGYMIDGQVLRPAKVSIAV